VANTSVCRAAEADGILLFLDPWEGEEEGGKERRKKKKTEGEEKSEIPTLSPPCRFWGGGKGGRGERKIKKEERN